MSGTLTTRELADRLGVSTRTVERWRASGDGPPFLRLTRGGPVRYPVADVEAWERARRFESTADESAQV